MPDIISSSKISSETESKAIEESQKIVQKIETKPKTELEKKITENIPDTSVITENKIVIPDVASIPDSKKESNAFSLEREAIDREKTLKEAGDKNFMEAEQAL